MLPTAVKEDTFTGIWTVAGPVQIVTDEAVVITCVHPKVAAKSKAVSKGSLFFISFILV
jgi:hypothetical protein